MNYLVIGLTISPQTTSLDEGSLKSFRGPSRWQNPPELKKPVLLGNNLLGL